VSCSTAGQLTCSRCGNRARQRLLMHTTLHGRHVTSAQRSASGRHARTRTPAGAAATTPARARPCIARCCGGHSRHQEPAAALSMHLTPPRSRAIDTRTTNAPPPRASGNPRRRTSADRLLRCTAAGRQPWWPGGLGTGPAPACWWPRLPPAAASRGARVAAAAAAAVSIALAPGRACAAACNSGAQVCLGAGEQVVRAFTACS
jgi:hypothetical protein